MSTPWIDVNLPFRLSQSPEMSALNQRFIAVVNAAKKAFKEAEPLLARWELTEPDDSAQALALQDQYPWLREHLTAPDVEKWFAQAGYRIQHEVPENLRKSFIALVQHRYAYVKMNAFINTFPDVLQSQKDIAALRDKEHSMQFCNHPMCKTGVLIEVLTPGDEGPPRQLLIGDVNAYGTDGGCCPTGLRDEEVITRYKDFSYILKDV